jgi:hypothetical protein
MRLLVFCAQQEFGMDKVFMPRPIADLVILGVGQSSQSWPGLVAKEPGFNGQVWTINAGGLAFRHHVVFDMHTEEYVFAQEESKLRRIMERRKWFETHDRPVVMPKALPQYPTSLTYPMKLVADKLKTDYFTNGMAYMLAMAHLCDVKRLFVMGADFLVEKPGDHVVMEDGRACMEYWLGRLVERGCNVLVTDKSPVLGASARSAGSNLYGYHMPVLQTPDYTREVTSADQ